MKLPIRLLAIARFIPAGRKVADIGTDHAILPVYLIREKISPEVIASDLNQGPLEAAAKTVAQSGFEDKIQLRLGYGLNTINPGETDLAVIAGMGGGTIRNILEEEGRIYEIIYTVKGREEITDQVMISLGPRLVEKKHPLLKKLVKREIEANKNIAAALSGSKKPEAVLKQQIILERNKNLECFLYDC